MTMKQALRNPARVVLVAALLSTACSGRFCGSAESPASQASGAVPDMAMSGLRGPGLRRGTTENLSLSVPRTFDLSHVDPAAFAKALGNDPVRIFEFLRDRIAFESYVGCLRGPRGTLMAMAGNSVDRAALLSSLLADAGQRVRFARGTLPEQLAGQLVASIWADRPWLDSRPRGDQSSEFKAIQETFGAAVQKDGVALRDALRRAGYPKSEDVGVTLPSLVREAEDHYWVQWWHDGAWVDMDPSFEASAPGQTYAKVESVFETLPSSMFHRLVIRIRVEEYRADQPATRDVLRYESNTADLSTVDFVLTHERVTQQEPGEVRPLMAGQQGRVAGEPFWLSPPRGNAAGGLLDAFGGGDAPAVPLTTAEWIELDTVAPGGQTETVQREVFDRLGPERRLAGEQVGASTIGDADAQERLTRTTYDLLVTTGAIDAVHLGGLVDPPPVADSEAIDIRAALRRIGVSYSSASDAVLTRMAGLGGWVCRFYLVAPRVQITDLSMTDGVARLSLDIRRDQSRAIVTGFDRQHLFYAQVLRGVVDGTLERIVVDYFTVGGNPAQRFWTPGVSTSSLFEQTRAAGVPGVLLAGNGGALGADVPRNGRARIEQSLAAGMIAFAPARPIVVNDTTRFAWWQVEPHSGVTTAVTDEGLYQDVAEVSIMKEKDGTTSVNVKMPGGNKTYHFSNPKDARLFAEGMQWHLNDENFLTLLKTTG